jgi:hypothetical protein
MMMAPTLAAAPPVPHLRAGRSVDPRDFKRIRTRMLLEFCKWDPQVGDVSTLCPFPLILPQSEWREICAAAEAMTRETLAMEERLLGRPDLYAHLGLSRQLRRLMERAPHERLTPAACRVMRFDFHPTPEGWRVSEVNSDVPGGFAEASAFPALVAGHVSTASPAGDPGARYADVLAGVAAEHGGAIALVAAPGYMEDQQVIQGLARRLRERDVPASLTDPQSLEWRGRRAFLGRGPGDAGGTPPGAIVRFYQGEWLAGLRPSVSRHLFVGGETPVANPGCAILSESKRLPLVWEDLAVACPTWKRYLPDTRDSRDVRWTSDDGWLLKTAFCNTGDSVTVRELLPDRIWARRRFDIWSHPCQWVAQRRFSTTPVDTPAGAMFPCLGIYTIDGQACGIYGRLSSTPVVDYSAMDVAVLVERTREENQHNDTQ